MTLIQYYNSVFGNTPVSIVDNLRRIETLLSGILLNLPNKIFIKDRTKGVGYQIDFTIDKQISYEEFSMLHALFYQAWSISDQNIEVTCDTDAVKSIPLNELFQKFPGMFKFLRSILFLDFHNAGEFINNSISLYELYLRPQFSYLPSADKKDFYMKRKADVASRIEKAQNEFDILSVDYTKFLTDIENLHKVIFQMESVIKTSNQEYVGATAEIVSTKRLQDKSRKAVRAVKTAQRIIEENNQKILDISRLDKITISDTDRQKKLRRANVSKAKLIENLELAQRNILDEIDSSARSAMNTSLSRESSDTVVHKLAKMKEDLLVAEERKKLSFDRMSELKTSISGLKLGGLEIDERLSSDIKPVDVSRLAASNVLELDKEISMQEKTSRFLVAYFNYLDARGFLTLTQRRDLLVKIEPQLKVKSLCAVPGVDDLVNFISVIHVAE